MQDFQKQMCNFLIKHGIKNFIGVPDSTLKNFIEEATKRKKIIIATYKMAEEGLDIKTLTTLVMVTPKTDVCQAVGRILRQRGVDHLIIDIVDQHGVFNRQWEKRRAYYKKQKYTIKEIDKDDYGTGEWTTTFKKGEKKNREKKNKKLQIGKCLID